MPYEFTQPAPEDEEIVEYQERPLTRAEKYRMDQAQAQQDIQTIEDQPRRSQLSTSASQVKEVLYDPKLPGDILNGPMSEDVNYIYQKASRIPSFDEPAQRQALRAAADLFDASDVPQFRTITKRLGMRMMLNNEYSISRTDKRSTSESGVSSITIQKQSSDYKVSTQNTTPPTSIFEGLFNKNKKVE